MSTLKVVLLTLATMIAFAANSLLCRLALRSGHIDAASFTFIRLASGALILWIVVSLRSDRVRHHGDWLSAIALFAYAGAFSLAYVSLPASVGALILFGAVQATMIGYGLWQRERLDGRQSVGLALACAGLLGLLFPGLSAPPLGGALLMTIAGIAWGVYSLRGRRSINALAGTAGNFMRALPFALVLSLVMLPGAIVDATGVGYAIASGALASGFGYAIWYTTLPHLPATHAAMVQLSVPVIAAMGSVALLGETITPRLVVASVAVLGGIALAVLTRRAGR